MRVTFFISTLKGGGAERTVCALASFLAERHEVRILAVTETGSGYPIDPRVRITCLKRPLQEIPSRVGKGKELFRMSLRLIAALQEPTDVYVVFLADAWRIFSRFLSLIRCPVVYAERSDPRLQKKEVQAYMKRSTQHCQGLVFQLPEIQGWYASPVKAQTVIPNAVQVPDLPVVNARRKAVVSVGRLHYFKDPQLLLRAFAAIHADHPDLILEYYGEGEEEEDLRKKIHAYGLEEKVILKGYCQDVQELIAEAAVFVLPSRYEGMSNALAEAMALGLPCIASNVSSGGSRFLIEDGKNGLLVPCGDKGALVQALRRILDDPSFAETLGKNAREDMKRLRPEETYPRWESFLRAVSKKENA